MFGQNYKRRRERIRVRKWSIRVLALASWLVAAGIFALSAQASSIFVFERSITSFNNMDMDLAVGLAMDEHNNLYVSDDKNNRIVIFDENWAEVAEITVTRPGRLAIHQQVLYAVSDGSEIYRYDLDDNYAQIGSAYYLFDALGPSPITGIAVDSSGNIYANSMYYLARVDPSGVIIQYLNLYNLGMYDGQGLALDEADTLYVLTDNGNIHRWDKNKGYLGYWNHVDQYTWDYMTPYKTGLAYLDGKLVVTAHAYATIGFFTVSTATGQMLDLHEEVLPQAGYMTFDALIHPVTKQIYVTYRHNFEPDGVWVYEDTGTTAAVTATLTSIQYGNEVTIKATITANNGKRSPGGSVTFKDGAAELATRSLTDGTASLTTSDLAVGIRSITVQYGGDSDYAGSTSAPVVIEVSKIPSTVNLQSSAATSAWGDLVELTATVSGAGPGAAAPAGMVTFKSGETVLGTAALQDGAAVWTVDNLAVGTHEITAAYGGDAVYTPGSDTITQTVNKAATVTTAESSPSITVFGEQVTFKAEVTTSAPGAVPTGDVVFRRGAEQLGSASLDNGEATITLSQLAVGEHAITVEYAGDSTFAGSSGTFDHTVNKAQTTTALSLSAETSVFGETVRLTATVAASAPSSAAPEGTVRFQHGATVLGTATISGGEAALDVSDWGVGSYSITAQYVENGSFQDSEDTRDLTVNKASTSISISSSQDTAVFGEPVTFTAEVTAVSPGAGQPTGVVIFWNGADKLGEDTLSGGFASIDVSNLPVGSHTITADYVGDSSFETDSGSASQTVNRIAVTTAVTTSNGTSMFGEAVTFTATVTPASPAGGTPTGTVIFNVNGTQIGTAMLMDGTAVLSGMNELAVGTYTVTAEYSGATLFAPSSGSVQQIVGLASTTTAVDTLPETSVYGEQITLTATVTVTVPGTGAPSGDVTFISGTTTLGTVQLSGGKATMDVSSLSVGTHSITAQYGGDGAFAASQYTVSHTITKADTTISLTSSVEPAVFGQPVKLTASVTAQAPGAGTPTGEVVFKNGAITLGTVSVSGGLAILDVNDLVVDTNTITAEYSGDSSFVSSDTFLQQTIHPADTVTVVVPSKGTNAFGEPVTFTATVSAAAPGAGMPTGKVTFHNGAVELGEVTLVGGAASIVVDDLAVGAHTIAAVYSGDSSFAASGGSVLHEVGKTSSATSITTSHGASVYGENVSITVTVSDAVYGKVTPSGTVTLTLGGNTLGTGTLDDGEWTLHVDTMPVGSHTIQAQYSGDSSFAASSDVVTVTVMKADSATDAAASTNTSKFGDVVTITADITATAPGSGTPTGIVTLLNGAETISTMTLVDGKVTIDVGELPVGSHTIDVVYGGDDSFNPSTAQIAITVDRALTEAVLTANQATVMRGRPITLTAHITALAPAAGMPTGKVTFFDTDGEIDEVVLHASDKGVAELVILESWRAGRYELYVEYEGDEQFQGSQSAAYTLTVRAPSSSEPVPELPQTSSSDGNIDGDIVIAPGESGTVSLGEAITVIIPTQMSTEQLRLTIEEVTASANLEGVQETLVSEVYEILINLAGTFEKPLTLSFLFDPAKLKPGETAAIFYFDEEGREWIEIGGIVDGNVVSVQVDHLTKFAVFAIAKEPLPEETAAPNESFRDVRGHWGEEAILQAVQLGIVSGYPDGVFRPDHSITRAEFIVMLASALQIPETSSTQDVFTDDRNIGAWAKAVVYAARKAGIVSGYDDGSFRPDAYITRAEMAVMAARALGLSVDATAATAYVDDELVPQWAKGAAEAVRQAGIMSGRDGNRMAPGDNATRAEAVSIIMRSLGSDQ